MGSTEKEDYKTLREVRVGGLRTVAAKWLVLEM